MNTIILPSYISSTGQMEFSCPDHICNKIGTIYKNYVLRLALSGHFFVATVFETKAPDHQVKISFRSFSDVRKRLSSPWLLTVFQLSTQVLQLQMNWCNNSQTSWTEGSIIFFLLWIKKIAWKNLNALWIYEKFRWCINETTILVQFTRAKSYNSWFF